VLTTKHPASPRAPSLFTILFISVFLLGVYVRFVHLADNPGWDSDEGYNWSIANNLASGQLRMYALAYTFVQHPPLFYLIGAALMRAWTHDLIALRAISASCGLLTMVVLFAIGRGLGGNMFGLAAMGFYALWPQSVVQTRWAYTYNLLALLIMLAVWAAMQAADEKESTNVARDHERLRQRRASIRRSAIVAGVFAGLALTTDQEAIAIFPAMALLLWQGGPRVLIVGAVSAAVAPAAYIGWMLMTRGADFLFDISHTASRLTAGPGELGQRLDHLVNFDPFIGLGMIGLLVLRPGLYRRSFIVLMAFVTALVLEVRDPAPYFHAAEPLLPVSAIGIGALTSTVLRYLSRFRSIHAASTEGLAANRRSAEFGRIAGVLLLAPIALSMTVIDVRGVNGQFTTAISALLPKSTSEARDMAAWVNARVTPTDLVLIMPSSSWLFHCRTAEFLQSIAISGHGTAFYPDGLHRDRFAYDTRPPAARFVVIDNFARLWIRESAPGRVIVNGVVKGWPRVYVLGEYAVYQNPASKGVQ
jgi:hypothetical protein